MLIDSELYPLAQPDSPGYQVLLRRCQDGLAVNGLFNLPGFLRPEVTNSMVEQLKPTLATDAFTHRRSHNIYFQTEHPDLPVHHPALAEMETVNHTLCAD